MLHVQGLYHVDTRVRTCKKIGWFFACISLYELCINFVFFVRLPLEHSAAISCQGPGMTATITTPEEPASRQDCE